MIFAQHWCLFVTRVYAQQIPGPISWEQTQLRRYALGLSFFKQDLNMYGIVIKIWLSVRAGLGTDKGVYGGIYKTENDD